MAVICALLMSACTGDIVGEYCTYQSYYVMDFQYGYTTSPLYAALTSTNTFAFFSCAPYDGGYKLYSQGYGTDTHTDDISLEILTRPTRVLGLNNGLIVGRSSFQNNELYVFDRQCPNCYKNYGRTNYMLVFSDAQNVICNTCQRKYGLLNGGVVVAGDNGEKLFRYHATMDGQLFKIANPQ